MTKYIVFDCDGTLIDTSQSRYSLYPGIKDLLVHLSANHTLYVWTARDRSSTLRILQELGVIHFFEGFCTCDDAYPKPHVRGIGEMLGKINKADVCVIGDTVNDILGAKNFGVKSIAAAWNKNVNLHLLNDSGADFIAFGPSECLTWLSDHLI